MADSRAFLAKLVALAALGTGALAGCQEKLTAPGACPELCPGGQLTVVDTVIDAIPGSDTSHVGYVDAGTGDALLVSTGLPGSEDRAIMRFARRPSIFVVGADTVTDFTIDSVAFAFNVRGRDTTVSGVRVILYRLPATTDTTATFASIEPLLIDANLIDTVVVPADSLNFTVRTVLRGVELPRVAIADADSGVIAIGMRIASPVPTGLRIGSAASGAGVTFTTYYTLDIENENFRNQEQSRGPAFNRFVSQGVPVPNPDLLAVGGEPSARALVRFNFPPKLRDSVAIVRATLELVPASPLFGLPNETTFLEARPLVGDFGAKSPLCVVGGVCGTTLLTGATAVALEESSADTVRFEVPQIVRSWQGNDPAPSALFLLVRPEASTFLRPVFFSTRSGGGAPRLRISYVTLPSSTSP